MGPSENEELARRALKSYELGRFQMAARIFYVLVPAVCIGYFAGAPREELLCIAVLLASTAVWLRWRGKRGGPAVLPGLLAGFLPLAAVPIAKILGLQCDVMSVACLTLVVGSGLASGVILGWYAARKPHEAIARWATAALIASMTACLSCVSFGIWGVAGAAVGIFFSGGLSAVIARARLARA